MTFIVSQLYSLPAAKAPKMSATVMPRPGKRKRSRYVTRFSGAKTGSCSCKLVSVASSTGALARAMLKSRAGKRYRKRTTMATHRLPRIHTAGLLRSLSISAQKLPDKIVPRRHVLLHVLSDGVCSGFSFLGELEEHLFEGTLNRLELAHPDASTNKATVYLRCYSRVGQEPEHAIVGRPRLLNAR